VSVRLCLCGQYNKTEQLNGTGGCLLEALNLSSFGALHGAFHVGRILGAITKISNIYIITLLYITNRIQFNCCNVLLFELLELSGCCCFFIAGTF